MNEADTCRKFVVPKLQAAGWDNAPHSIAEQRYFTDGRIVVRGSQAIRKPGKRADYLLRYGRDFPIGIVEAKSSYKNPGDGLQQAKESEDKPEVDPTILQEPPAAYGSLSSSTEEGAAERIPDVLKVPPISDHGKVNEIIGKFGAADRLRDAVNQLQSLLYAA
jgi:hypothetical protein